MISLKTLGPFALCAVVLLPTGVSANELKFQFTNPSFGGNPLGGSYIAALAEAQRSATARDADSTAGAGVGGGGIGGPTIIVPITQGSAGAPDVGTEANAIEQVSN